MDERIRVLHVDDDPELLELTAIRLERARESFDVATATSADAGLSLLAEESVDCVVSDYEMPGTDGLEFLERVRERNPDLPFVLFTGKGSEAIASEAISAGVTDYLRKGSTETGELLADRIENVVAKRRSEVARRETERERSRYRTLVEAVGDPMYVLDADGYFTMVNDAMVGYTGFERADLLESHVSNFVDDDDFRRATERLRSTAGDEHANARVEVAFEDDGGDRRIGEANVTALSEGGEITGSVGVVRDLTGRKERERELARYETIIETAPVGMFVLDEAGRLTWVNDEFVALHEEREEELLGLRFFELIDRGYYRDELVEKTTDVIRRLLSSKSDEGSVTYDVQFTTSAGEERIYVGHTGLLPLADGEFQGTVNVFRDVTERERSKRELERQNERLEEFAGLVSHDLRNPLTVAQGYLEIVAEECDVDAVADVSQSLERMDELIDDLLSLARHGRAVGELESVGLATLAESAWGTADTAAATLELEATGRIRADEGRVRQLFENLFRNAVDHGGENVTVTVGTLPLETDRGRDDFGSGKEAAAGFFVADDGPGLPADVDDVFEIGYTTDRDGTGFGLGIVREIAEAHGWSVRACDDADRGGARFEVRDVTVLEAPTDHTGR